MLLQINNFVIKLVVICVGIFCFKMKDFIENNKENGKDFFIIFNYDLLYDIG